MEEGEAPRRLDYCLGRSGEGRILMERTRKLIKRQDEMLTREALLRQADGVPGAPELNGDQLLTLVEALFWGMDREGTFVKKNARRQTNRRDQGVCGLGLELLLGCPPTMDRQTAWYPDVYKPASAWTCPMCSPEEEEEEETVAEGETVVHLIECGWHRAGDVAWQEEVGKLTKGGEVRPAVGGTMVHAARTDVTG
jgi:hypothetical protein